LRVAPVRLGVDRGDPLRGGDGEVPVEVREEVSAARRLPAELCAEGSGVEGDEHQVAPAREVAAQGLGELGGGGEVDEAVPEVDRGAAVGAGHGRVPPLGGRADLEDEVAVVGEHHPPYHPLTPWRRRATARDKVAGAGPPRAW